MIIVLKPGISKKMESTVLAEIRKRGYRPHVMRGVARTVIGAIGDELTHASLESLVLEFPQAVECVNPIQKRYKLVSREAHPTDSTVAVRDQVIGGNKFQVMAGPCSVESEQQLLATAEAVKAAGATILRGGAFKPRTSPYEFQGLGEKGLKLLAKARRGNRFARDHGTAVRGPRRVGGGIHGHHSNRRAQFAEFPVAHRRGQNRQTRAAQARFIDAHRGMVAGRRIRPGQ